VGDEGRDGTPDPETQAFNNQGCHPLSGLASLSNRRIRYREFDF
jgi:hypothetical protein